VVVRLPNERDIRTQFKSQLDADSKFLAAHGVMDYSLLVGISKNPKEFDNEVERGVARRQTNYGWRTQQTMIPSVLIAAVSGAPTGGAPPILPRQRYYCYVMLLCFHSPDLPKYNVSIYIEICLYVCVCEQIRIIVPNSRWWYMGC
jgi:hypothetical protein